MSDLEAINDVFIISSSGLPYYSGCFGGENCAKEPNHLLVSGFLAAVFQFSLQFGQKAIREVHFDEAQMAIETRKIGEQHLLIIFFASKKIKMKKLLELVKRSASIFEINFSELIQRPKYHPKLSDFKSFSQILREMGIIKKELMGEIPILNSCQYSSKSELKEYVYCSKIQKDIPIQEELQYRKMDNECPHLVSQHI